MIQRVWERCREAKRLREVIVATDDARIADTCRSFGARVAMTRPDHPTGTDRLAEVARELDDAIVVNVQGDEPLVEGFVIDAAIEALESDAEASMSTVVHAAAPGAGEDPNRVKVVLDRAGHALYFSRSLIPHARDPEAAAPLWQHVGLYAYRRSFLLEFVGLERTPAECSEELEQLRALEHGHRIRAAIIEGWCSLPVDVPEDVARVEAALARERPGTGGPSKR
jgi:3-deoxy-manno-octulosonate cytidylyltransferase (CMP-KDO synthetase)